MSDGKFVPEGLVEVTKLATENDEKIVEMATEVAEECRSTADDDPYVNDNEHNVSSIFIPK